jgi:hypothetical protein
LSAEPELAPSLRCTNFSLALPEVVDLPPHSQAYA